MKNLNYTLDMIQSYTFMVLAVVSYTGALINNAWWHFGTTILCIILSWVLRKEARKEAGK